MLSVKMKRTGFEPVEGCLLNYVPTESKIHSLTSWRYPISLSQESLFWKDLNPATHRLTTDCSATKLQKNV